MPNLFGIEPAHLVSAYGYWAVLVVVAMESMGLPLPGETILVAAAIYAGTTHGISIPFVILAAAAGAVIGDNIGFWIGRELGFRLLVRYGPRIGLTEPQLKLGQYVFRRHGGKVVFFGRFVALLRALAALLAGANRMTWPRFLVFNFAGGVVWATIFGIGGYVLGESIMRFSGPVGIGLAAGAVLAAGVGFVLVRRNEKSLLAAAERALPGPLENAPSAASGSSRPSHRS